MLGWAVLDLSVLERAGLGWAGLGRAVLCWVGLIAHNSHFWNWRTCPPISEDKLDLSSGFGGQFGFVLRFWRTN